MGIVAKGVDYYLVYRFIKALVTPFKNTKAFKLGIIDDEGNVLKKHKELKTSEEKKAYGYFERMVWNIKKLVGGVPIIGDKLGSFVTAAYLILKEDNSLEEYRKNTFLKFAWNGLSENAPTTNTVGVAGLPPDPPPVSKKAQKKIRKKNKKKKKKKKDYEVISFNEFIGGQG